MLNLIKSKSTKRFKNSSKKAQSAIEFISLVAFAMLFFAIFLTLLQRNLTQNFAEQDDAHVHQVFNIIDSEIKLAQGSPAVYTRSFDIPSDIQGVPFNLSCKNGADIVIDFKDKQYIYFLDQGVSGGCLHVHSGENSIRKFCYPGALTKCPVEFT